LRSGNRNPRRNFRTDAAAEICSLRNFGFVSVAKEYVQAASPSFAAIERDPQRLILTIHSSSEKPVTNTPHLNPLPVSGARQRSAQHSPQGCRSLTIFRTKDDVKDDFAERLRHGANDDRAGAGSESRFQR
jgi:hypothetical protein